MRVWRSMPMQYVSYNLFCVYNVMYYGRMYNIAYCVCVYNNSLYYLRITWCIKRAPLVENYALCVSDIYDIVYHACVI